jgi:hypothetical protein
MSQLSPQVGGLAQSAALSRTDTTELRRAEHSHTSG